jgi:hypothetical protein
VGFEASFNKRQSQLNSETIAFTEETFGECFHKAAIVKSNGNVRLGVCGYEIFVSVRFRIGFPKKPRFRFGFGFPKI